MSCKTREVSLILTLLLLISCLTVFTPVQSQNFTIPETYSQNNENLSENGTWQINPAIWGDIVVWEDYREDPYGSGASPGTRNSNIYMYNLTTGEGAALTDNESSQANPDIWENHVVWEDYRHGEPVIYMIDISEEQPIPERIDDTDDPQKRPRIHGGRIVWEDYRDNSYGDIYMYDMTEDEIYEISAFKDNELPVMQRNPDIYGDRVVWTDYRQGRFTGDIYTYDLSMESEDGTPYYKKGYLGPEDPAESPVADEPINQHSPSIYDDVVVWTEYSNDTNNIMMKRIGSERLIVSAESTSEESPMIFAGRVVFQERDRNEERRDSIWMYNIHEETKTRVASVELQEDDPPGVVYARNTAIYRNRIVWEERHHSDHPNLDYQYDIYYTYDEPHTPEILSSFLRSHTGEEGNTANVTLEEGAYIEVEAEILDTDDDLKEVRLETDILGDFLMEPSPSDRHHVNITIYPDLTVDRINLRVVAEDEGGRKGEGEELVVYLTHPPVEITYFGVGTDPEDLNSNVTFLLEENKTLYFMVEVDAPERIPSNGVRLYIENFNLSDDYFYMGFREPDQFVFEITYSPEMSEGNKTAYAEVEDMDGHTTSSDEVSIRAVSPEDDIFDDVSSDDEDRSLYLLIYGILITLFFISIILLIYHLGFFFGSEENEEHGNIK